jgi:prepilin peptidase CpaA
MIIQAPESTYATAALVCAAVGALYDIREHRIPNWLTGSSIVLGLALHLRYGGWWQLGSALLSGLIAGGVFLILFLLRSMGAGDVKLMTAIGCMVGLGALSKVMVATVLIGSVCALLLAWYRGKLRHTIANLATLAVHHQENGFQPHSDLNLDNQLTLRLPYAVPIAIGCLVNVGALAMRVM